MGNKKKFHSNWGQRWVKSQKNSMGDNGSLIKITALVTEFVVKCTVIQFFHLTLLFMCITL